MKRYLLCAVLALAALALVLFPGPAAAANWSADSVSDLVGAINAANQAGGSNTITLAGGRTFTLTAVNNTTDGPTGLPVIAANNNLTIRGSSATIARSTTPGTPAFRLFVVASGASLTLQNLTIANAMVLAPARMNAFGGAILNETGGTLIVSQTVFLGNQAIGGDGGKRPGGWGFGGAIKNDGAASLDHDTFSGNQAFGGATAHGRMSGGYGFGGAVANGNGGTLTISHCSFAGNRAIGGLRHRPSAEFDGIAGSGAIDNWGTASITDSTFTDNQAIGGAADPGVNGGYSVGGAIGSGGPAAYSPVCTIERCAFNRNLAIGADSEPGTIAGAGIGGALSNGFSRIVSTITVTDCSFTANQAIGGNGGVGGDGVAGAFNLESPSAATVANSAFTENRAVGRGGGGSGYGGAIRNADLNADDGSGATLTISGSTFTGNKALGADGGDGVNSYAFADAGAVDTSGNTTVLNSVFKENRAIGGALLPGAMPSADTASTGGALSSWGGALYVRDSSFEGNQVIGCVRGTGGAGSAAMGGGIEIASGLTVAVVNCWFSNNAAVGGAGGSGAPGGPGMGGGIDVKSYPLWATAIGPSSTVTVTATTLRDNLAIGGAGGLGANGGDGIGGGCSVGTGIFFGTVADTSSITFDGSSLVESNRAIGGAGGQGGNGGSGQGGGLYNQGTATLAQGTISGNKAKGGTAGAGGQAGGAQGGGVFNGGEISIGALMRIFGNKPDDCFGCQKVSW